MSTSSYSEDRPGPAGSGVAIKAERDFRGMLADWDSEMLASGKSRPSLVFDDIGAAIDRLVSNQAHSYQGFRPLSDQVLVRPLPASDRLSSSSLILIPGSHDRGRLDNKLGTVLALGPGDPAALKCGVCGGSGRVDAFTVRGTENCDVCGGTGYLSHTRTAFEVSVGDTVLYAPRGWAEIEIAGETLCVLHDCQHVIAVVDPETVLFTEDPTTKKKAPDWIK